MGRVRISAALLLAIGLAAPLGAAEAARQAAPLVVEIGPRAQGAGFRPDVALGAGIDGAQKGDIDRLFTAHNVRAMRSLGLRPVTYRLRTELGIQAWHWNPRGTWSDPARRQGYWTSSANLGDPIELSWGYDLPRRGDTVDNANNTGWSRLTDGDLGTFWKSNPYLDRQYTGEAVQRPQWFIVQLADAAPVDAVQIDWAAPYAVDFEVQYWTGADDYDPKGAWRTFPQGAVSGANGGTQTLRLSAAPLQAQYLRVLLKTSSGTSLTPTEDVRDRLGFAVREVGFGTLGADGAFHDVVVHAASHDGQTFTHASSTDPWHRAIDRNPDLEQVGVDRFFRSGITNGLPAMMPVGVLFDTPANAAALVAYLKARRYPLARLELGEEPDGQYGEPADYGALYLEAVDAIRRVDGRLPLGGPSLQSAGTDLPFAAPTERSWNRRFVAYLTSRGRLGDLQFFSFEHYPFDDICGDIPAKLLEESRLLPELTQRVAEEGVPRTIPWVIAEYGLSAFSGRAEVEMPAALFQADLVGQFLQGGGDVAYMFGYGPNLPVNQHQPCAGFGNMTPFLADADGQAGVTTATFVASRLISQTWLQPGHGLHRFMPIRVRNSGSGDAVRAHAVARPDGRLAVMLLNRGPRASARVQLRPVSHRTDQATIAQYGPAQYRWHDDGPRSRPELNLPPKHWRASVSDVLVLPPLSMTVVVTEPSARQGRGGGGPLSGRRSTRSPS